MRVFVGRLPTVSTLKTRISMAVRKTTATKKETEALKATSEVSTEKPTATQPEAVSAVEAHAPAAAPAAEVPVKPKRVWKKRGEPRGPHGGARPGAGRPPIDGKRFAATYRIRISAELHARCIAAGSTEMRSLLTNYFALKDSVPDADPQTVCARYAEEKKHDIPTNLPAANLQLPKLDLRAACGFPNPSTDADVESFSPADYLARRPDATFVVEASGDSMIDAGIHDGDMVFVDRTAEPRPGKIVLAHVDGNFTIKELAVEKGQPKLLARNEAAGYAEIVPEDLDSFRIEGVVVGLARRF